MLTAGVLRVAVLGGLSHRGSSAEPVLLLPRGMCRNSISVCMVIARAPLAHCSSLGAQILRREEARLLARFQLSLVIAAREQVQSRCPVTAE